MRKMLLIGALVALVSSDVYADAAKKAGKMPPFYTGYAVVCDSVPQMRRYAQLFLQLRNVEKARLQTNSEFKTNSEHRYACSLALIAFRDSVMTGDVVRDNQMPEGAYIIERVTIIGVYDHKGRKWIAINNSPEYVIFWKEIATV